MSIKLLFSLKVPSQPQECYDWFHRISAKFTLCHTLLFSEIFQHKIVSEKERGPRHQIQSSSTTFWILLLGSKIKVMLRTEKSLTYNLSLRCIVNWLSCCSHKTIKHSDVTYPVSGIMFHTTLQKSYLKSKMFADFIPSQHEKNNLFPLAPTSDQFKIWNKNHRPHLARKSSLIPI